VVPAAGLIRTWLLLIGSLALVVTLSACAGSTKSYTKRSAPQTYTVHKGETLYAIAHRYGLNYRRVAAWNGIHHPYTIYPGQRIRLRAPTSAASHRNRPSAGSTKTRASPPPAREVRSVDGRGLKWLWPTQGQVIGTYWQGRKGIDIAGRAGQPVRAAAPGRVVYSGSGLKGYGQLIIINHDRGYLTAYAHNRRLLVQEGEQVRAGQDIAELGDSGTNRAKLHFEIRRNGKPVDPLRYLPKAIDGK
jgi:lipoprotein NlpD